MIPLFPRFKKLDLEDKEFMQEYVREFPPYSDFNFVSLYSYNTLDSAEISLLNNNLVIKFSDYTTNEFFCTFIGRDTIIETVRTLLNYAESNNLLPKLQLIPHAIAEELIKVNDDFFITEDIDNFDYVLSTDDISNLIGNKYGPKRNFVNRFKRLYPEQKTIPIDLADEDIQRQIIELFYFWEKKNNKRREETETELIAIKRLLAACNHFELLPFGVYYNNELIAFSIEEVVHKGYGMIHFEKANTDFIGIYQYLKNRTALEFKEKNVHYINYEQDLGIEGLRKAKLSWYPIHYLKKYIITTK